MRPTAPPDGVLPRMPLSGDAEALGAAYLDNRELPARWEPRRGDGFFTVEGPAASRSGCSRTRQGAQCPG